jgi:hypothetical protein
MPVLSPYPIIIIIIIIILMVCAAHCWDVAPLFSYLILYTVGVTTWKGCIKSK